MGFLDNFRYPGFNLTAQPQLPGVFGPANQSAQIQGAIAGMVDPIVERLNKQQQDASAKRVAELAILNQQYQQPTSVTPPAQSTAAPVAAGTPGGDEGRPAVGTPLAGIREEVRQTARQIFADRGIDPDVAERVIRQESGFNPGARNVTDKERSYGVAQLNEQGGLGAVALQQGIDPKDPRQWKQHLEFMADTVAKDGWRQWYGARDAGISRWQGIGEAPARTAAASPPAFTPAPAPQPAPVASFAPQVAPAPNPAAAAAVTAPQAAAGQLGAPAGYVPPYSGRPAAPGPQQPGPQAQAPQQQAPQDQQLAQQQEIIANVGAGNQEVTQRLNGVRQAGQQARVQVASLSPELPGINLGGVMPGAPQPPPNPSAAYDPALTAPRPVPTTVEPPPPDVPLPPPRPPAPAGPSPAAPAAAAGAVVPPPAPAANPTRVAQNLPPLVADQQVQRPISDAQAQAMLNAATSAEQYNAILGMVLASRQPQKQSADRFQLIHDKDGNWVQLDRLTGATRAQPISGGPAGSPVSKEVREAERNLFNDFESTESVKKYRELEQGVQGLKSAFQGGSANADLVAVIQMFKAIDPGSTVTGGENATFRNAAGVPETLRALFNRGVGQGGQFSPELRAEIFNTAQRLQQGRVKQIEQHAQAYRNRAKAYGLDPDRTIAFQPFQFEKAKASDFPDIDRRREGEDAAAAPRAPLTAGSSRANPVDVPSMDAAERMPTGTYFRLPSGRIGIIE